MLKGKHDPSFLLEVFFRSLKQFSSDKNDPKSERPNQLLLGTDPCSQFLFCPGEEVSETLTCVAFKKDRNPLSKALNKQESLNKALKKG